MKYWILGSLAGGVMLVIAACAPISEDSCRAGNWVGIGARDGQYGAPVSRFAAYQKECAEYGIVPNQAQWMQGREQGLKVYCTPSNAYMVGTRGSEVNYVCPDMAALIVPNKAGLRYNAIDERIDELEDQAREIELRLRREFSGELTPDQARIRQQYRRLLYDIEDQIDDLRDERRDLPRY